MDLKALRYFGLDSGDSSYVSDALEAFTLRSRIIAHPIFCEAVREMARIHDRWTRSKVAEGLLLVAQTGSGKTTILEYYTSNFPRFDKDDVTHIPVLLVITPESPTVKTLAEAILTALGDRAAGKGTTQVKTLRIINYFEKCKVNMLLIDEFQHFFDGHRVAESKRVTDWLKNLINAVKIPVVIAGLPRAVSVLNSNPQLRRRFCAPHYVRPFGFDSQDEKKEFRALLKNIHGCLPVSCPQLHEANLARRFYYASHGLIDYVVKIIDDTVSRGGTGLSGAIVQEDFASAFRRVIWFDAPNELNPFFPNATLRHLTKPREPFDIWDDITRYTGPVNRAAYKRSSRNKDGDMGEQEHA